MANPKIVTREEWHEARQALLEKEKAHTSARDELTAARMAMPWVKVEKDYRFKGADGEVTLGDLFGDHTQLILQHFMFESDWEAGCSGCSFMADSVDPITVHLAQRDVAFAAVSVAPLDKLLAFRERMGWSFPWISSEGSDFNSDFGVTIDKEEFERGEATYNYQSYTSPHPGEVPGLSIFVKGEDDTIYHSYSAYARGLENTMAAYNFLDLVPKGRDEGSLDYGTQWLKLKDSYG